MTGIILIVAGALLLIIGVLLFNNGKEKINTAGEDMHKVIEMAIADGVLTNNEKTKIRELAEKNNMDYGQVIQQAEERLRNMNVDSETELVDFNQKNGLDFEKYIVQLFDRSQYKIKEWAGDKFVDGLYAETTLQPDIIFELKMHGKPIAFAVECKWRKGLLNDGNIILASQAQIDRYKNFERTKRTPVFIAVGLGGKGAIPENTYIIPLHDINLNIINISKLNKYKKKKGSHFHFDNVTSTLK